MALGDLVSRPSNEVVHSSESQPARQTGDIDYDWSTVFTKQWTRMKRLVAPSGEYCRNIQGVVRSAFARWHHRLVQCSVKGADYTSNKLLC